MKIRKKFNYNGIPLIIADRTEKHMNGKRTMVMTRAIAPNGGKIPMSINKGETLKDIMNKTITALDNFLKDMGRCGNGTYLRQIA